MSDVPDRADVDSGLNTYVYVWSRTLITCRRIESGNPRRWGGDDDDDDNDGSTKTYLLADDFWSQWRECRRIWDGL